MKEGSANFLSVLNCDTTVLIKSAFKNYNEMLFEFEESNEETFFHAGPLSLNSLNHIWIFVQKEDEFPNSE